MPANLKSTLRLVWLVLTRPAWRMVLAERVRQVDREGWTEAHDDEHMRGDMALAAACYAIPPALRAERQIVAKLWPWAPVWWKPVPTDRVRELTKAAALLLAEIERELRQRARAKKGGRI